MSKYSGTQFSLFLVDGYNLAPALSETADYEKESITQATNPFTAASEQNTPVGLEKASFKVGGGFFDPVTDPIHTALGQVVGVVRTICAAFEGNVVGRKFIGSAGTYSQKYAVMDVKDNLTKANVTYLVSGAIDEGVIVQNLAQFAADWDTKTGGAGVADSPVDNVVDVSNQTFHVTSNSGANPTSLLTPVPHGLVNGEQVYIFGVNRTVIGSSAVYAVTIVDSTHFTIPLDGAVAGNVIREYVRIKSSNGGAGYLQVTQFAGLTGFIGKIMHSPDDITYVTLITFSNATGITKERKTVAGVVDRFLSFNGDITGAGSITVFSGFSRN